MAFWAIAESYKKLEKIRQEGREQGRKEGRREGREQGRTQLLKEMQAIPEFEEFLEQNPELREQLEKEESDL